MNIKLGIEYYLTRKELRGQSEQTVKNNRFQLLAFHDWLSDQYNISDSKFIRKFHLQKYQKYLGTECQYKAGYINQKVICLNSFFNYLRKEGEATHEMENIMEPVKEPKRLPKVISMEQYDVIRNAVKLDNKMAFRDYTIITILMSSGIRVGALSMLDVTDVDLEEKTLRVISKGNKERLAIFGDACKEILKVYLDVTRPSWKRNMEESALFLSRSGKRLTVRSIQGVVKKIVKDAGIEERITPHTFRRTFCTELIKADGNLYHIAQMMGHESLEHLKCYTQLNITPLKETHTRCHPRG